MEPKHITSTLLIGGVWLFLIVQVPFFAEMSVVFGVINAIVALTGNGSWTGPQLGISLVMIAGAWLVIKARKKPEQESAD
jgi:hypothetical protein